MNEPVSLDIAENANCRIVNISDTGAKIECTPFQDTKKVGDTLNMTSDQLGSLEGKVVWEEHSDQKETLAVTFKKDTLPTRRKIIKIISDRNKGYHGNRS